jgi:predicted phage terminase large subunit-like protein
MSELLALHRAVLECNLHAFMREAWPAINPGSQYEDGWFIECVADHLTAVANGELRNLLINIPPRMGKSLAVNVFFPAWVWSQEAAIDSDGAFNAENPFTVAEHQFRGPGVKFGCISYDQSLSNQHSQTCRQLIESPWFEERWGSRVGRVQLREDENRIQKFSNTAGGERLALAFGGRITGFGADIIIVDDAHNVVDVESDSVREGTLKIWNEVLPSRRNDPRTAAFVVAMQRSHERDIAGNIIGKWKERGFEIVEWRNDRPIVSGWVHVRLPAMFEPNEVFESPIIRGTTGEPWTDLRSEKGESLWPERFPAKALAELRDSMTAHAWAGQYQQRPTAREGGMFKREWFANPVHIVPESALANRVRAWDLAGTEAVAKADPDWTVGLLMAHDRLTGMFYIMDVIRFRASPGTVKARVKATAESDTRLCTIRLPRDPGQAGKFQIYDFATDLAGYIIRPEPEHESKGFRAQAFASQCELGKVKLVHGAWNEAFVDELCRFPLGHDDQVDAASAGFRILHSTANFMEQLFGSYGQDYDDVVSPYSGVCGYA